MGTNYYYHEESPCPVCGRLNEPLHIGKSTGGWCFALHIYPEAGVRDLKGWLRLFRCKGTYILDEYGDRVSRIAMKKIITDRKWKGSTMNRYELEHNGAVSGPNGLIRCAIGHGCVGHGEGTWDLMVGDFS